MTENRIKVWTSKLLLVLFPASRDGNNSKCFFTAYFISWRNRQVQIIERPAWNCYKHQVSAWPSNWLLSSCILRRHLYFRWTLHDWFPKTVWSFLNRWHRAKYMSKWAEIRRAITVMQCHFSKQGFSLIVTYKLGKVPTIFLLKKKLTAFYREFVHFPSFYPL